MGDSGRPGSVFAGPGSVPVPVFLTVVPAGAVTAHQL